MTLLDCMIEIIRGLGYEGWEFEHYYVERMSDHKTIIIFDDITLILQGFGYDPETREYIIIIIFWGIRL